MQISAKLRALSDGTYGYYCPGCQELHGTIVGNALLGFDTTKPSFQHSVKIGNGQVRCHHNITKGKLIFGEDCLHKLRGCTVDMPDLPPEYQDSPR